MRISIAERRDTGWQAAGDCRPAGRREMREDGTMKTLRPEEEAVYRVKVSMIPGMEMWGRVTRA